MHHPLLIDLMLANLLMACAALLLAFAALHDFGFRTVPNWVSAALLAIGLGLRLMDHDLPYGLLAGALVFAAAFGCYCLGWMGGADVKLLVAVSLVVPPHLVPSLLVTISLAGGGLALSYIIGARIVRALHKRPSPKRPNGLLARAARCELRRLTHMGPLPYAAAIAIGSWVTLAAS